MEDHRALIEKFYSAFQVKDHKTMASCYHQDVVFSDPVFTELHGWKAKAMWRMLCERGKDLELQYSEVRAEGDSGSAHWEADYTFSQSGLKVHNVIDAGFKFRDGLIIEHRDRFDLRKWMGMALGLKGSVLGMFPFGRKAVSSKAMAGLALYIEKNGLSAAAFHE